MITIKKYSNRRLYDTEESRYITLDELHHKIRSGADVRVVDARTNLDLTQSTLAQIVIESRGAGRLLPVPLLVQMIRMGDDALAEFLGRYMTWALQVYGQMRANARAVRNPMAMFNMPWGSMPWNAGNSAWQQPPGPWPRAAEAPWPGGPSDAWEPPGAPNATPPQPPMPEAEAGHGRPPPTAAAVPPATDSASAELAELKKQIAELREAMIGKK